METRKLYDFGLLKVRSMKIKQAQAVIGDYQSPTDFNFGSMSHERLFNIINKQTDIDQKRRLSRWYFNKNGIYSRSVRYIADIYKFDFMLYPNLNLEEDDLTEERQKQIRKKFNNVLEHFDNSAIQLICRGWSQKVCIDGCYYGYICDDINDKIVIQDLPIDYCRSRYSFRGLPLVEFNCKYFDKVAKSDEARKRILSLFPEEFQKGYRDYTKNKLKAEDSGDQDGWIVLDLHRAFKFSFLDNDTPPFLSAIPSLIQLEEVQDLEKEKLLQQIQKILIQTFELDKNGQLPFTMPELQRLNQNALDMVGDAIGVSVLSTVANVHLEDLATNTPDQSASAVSEALNDVYTRLGISTNLFNTDGNLSLDKSIIIDEAFAKPLLLQFEQFFNRYLEWKFNKGDSKFRLKMLTTSIFNYKDMSNTYKDLTKLGFSRFLPMVALGHTQKEVASLAKLEQQILQLDAYMLPPFSSNTMSSDTWSDIKTLQERIIGGGKATVSDAAVQVKQGQSTNTTNAAEIAAEIGDSNKGGRPQLPDDKKSDKTIANNQSK